MRNSDVHSLMDHVEEDLGRIRASYEASLRDKDIPSSLRVDVKNVMENLRSALDYVAQDISDEVITPHRNTNGLRKVQRVYFPYGKDRASFDEAIGRNLPELYMLCPELYSAVEGVQAHSGTDGWLHDLCSIVNANKHDSLTPQEKKTRQRYTVGKRGAGPAISAPAGAIRAPPGAIRIGDAPVTIDPKTGIPVATPELDVTVRTWVSFNFEGTTTQVLPLLTSAARNIRALADVVYEVLA